jgi:hypothetical protein
LGDTHTVGEGRDVQHVEQGSLGSSDLATSLNELEIGGNFNGTTSNLGRDTESLEERSLSGFHTSVTSRDPDIIRSNGTSSGGSSNFVGQDLVSDSFEVAVGEDKSDIALYEWEETLILWRVRNETLDGTTNLHNNQISQLSIWHMVYRSIAYHGVLAHQYDSLSAKSLTDLVHLLGADIVNADNENAVVLLEKALELIEVAGLVI